MELETNYRGNTHQLHFAVVEEGDCLIGIHEAVQLGIVEFDKKVINYKNKLDNCFYKFNKFKVKSKDANCNLVSSYKFSLQLKEGVRPWISKERPIPFAMRKEVEKQIKDLVSRKVFTQTEQADWVSPIVCVKKPDGSIRLCGDFRKLNENLVEDKFPLPNIEDLFAEIGSENSWFAKIDLEAAYH